MIVKNLQILDYHKWKFFSRGDSQREGVRTTATRVERAAERTPVELVKSSGGLLGLLGLRFSSDSDGSLVI